MRCVGLVTIGAMLASFSSGCEAFDRLSERDATVQLHVTHHATPVGDVFPDRGRDGNPRVFETDEGWLVTLQEAFVVHTAAAIVRCDGMIFPVDLFWGPLPESMSDADLDLSSFGGRKLAPGQYCSVLLQYGPFEPIDEETAQTLPRPNNGEPLSGVTAYVLGFARKDDLTVPFELRATETIDVELDLAEQIGQPLAVKGNENFPVELTLSKTYDRFFDAVDFTTLAESELSANMMAVLGAETRVNQGTRVRPQ